MSYTERTVQFYIDDLGVKTASADVQYRLVGRETRDTLYNKDLTHPSNKINSTGFSLNGTTVPILPSATRNQFLMFDGTNLLFYTMAIPRTVQCLAFPTFSSDPNIISVVNDPNGLDGWRKIIITTSTPLFIDGVQITLNMRIFFLENHIYFVESINSNVYTLQVAIDARFMIAGDSIIVQSGNLARTKFKVVNNLTQSSFVQTTRTNITCTQFLQNTYVGEYTGGTFSNSTIVGSYAGQGYNGAANVFIGTNAAKNKTNTSITSSNNVIIGTDLVGYGVDNSIIVSANTISANNATRYNKIVCLTNLSTIVNTTNNVLENSVFIGNNHSNQNPSNSVSVGNNISNNGPGVNLFGQDITINNPSGTTICSGTNISLSNCVNTSCTGSSINISNSGTIIIIGNNITGDNIGRSTIIGNDITINSGIAEAVAIGNIKSVMSEGVAIGSNSSTTNGVSIGYNAGSNSSNGTGNIMVGNNANIDRDDSVYRITLGNNITNNNDSSAVIGNNEQYYLYAGPGGVGVGGGSSKTPVEQAGFYSLSPIAYLEFPDREYFLTANQMGPQMIIVCTALDRDSVWYTATLDDILTKMPNVVFGSSYYFMIRNETNNVISMQAGRGMEYRGRIDTINPEQVVTFMVYIIDKERGVVQRCFSSTL